MGIKGLFKVISDNAPAAVRITDYKILTGRKVAIDASMSLYQFLIAVRQTDGVTLAGEDGESTSHLIGMFYRTIKIVENGMKPVYVFDGKPPDMKSDELKKRSDAKEAAEKKKKEAEEAGNKEELARYERRTVHVSKAQNEEAKRLLRLMGIPVIDAPTEAEAQCAALARSGKVYAAASEDLDTLTFNSPILLRHLTAGDQKKNPITEIDLTRALEGLDMNMDTFIDLCILLGCDYCESIKGMGPQTALKLIREFKNIENIKKHLDEKGGKVQIPDNWPYEAVRKLFHTPELLPSDQVSLKWTEPDIDGLVEFLVKEKGFDEDRVRNGAKKLTKASSSAPQGRLTDFFKVKRPAPKQEPKVKKQKKN